MPESTPAPISDAERNRLTRTITTASVAVAVCLIVLKTWALWMSGSVAVLATLMDSSLDLIASLLTFLAVRWAAVPADHDHRHGHGKAEALAALVQAGLVFASAIFVGVTAVRRMINPVPIEAGGWAIVVMLVSMLMTGFLVYAQSRVVRRTGSIAIAGDRAHYTADLGANAVVIIGVASGVWLGAPGMDAAAGLIVGIWLFWGAFGLLREAGDHLLDRTSDPSTDAVIVALVEQDPAINNVHQLRTRRVGHRLFVQLHLDLDPDMTLRQTHDHVVGAENRIREHFAGADVIIHPDPRGHAERRTEGTSVPLTDTAGGQSV